MNNDTLYFTTHRSAIGMLLVVASHRGMRFLALLGNGETAEQRLAAEFGEAASATFTPLPGFFTSTLAALDRYLAEGGELKLPVDLQSGTALQRSVWLAIARIPYGKTISYSDLAERVGFPRAVRAVASACGANPIPLVIPCHRVLAKDGTLGGFSLGGLETKEYLLRIEAAPTQRAAVA